MNALESYRMSAESFESLRNHLARLADVVPFATEPKLASLVASLGIQRETGTMNDEMARFVFDEETGLVVPPGKLRAELVRFRDSVGVRIWAEGVRKIDLRFHGIRKLLHPRFSFDAEGSIYQCVIFPESVARIAAIEGADLVLVREWSMNTVFGGFDPSKHYYQTNFWELKNNDSLRFARLIGRRQLPLLGTHDLVAHVAGVSAGAWADLSSLANRVGDTLEDYFGEIRVPTVASLVLPYTAGVLLDDLAQPPNYGAPGQALLIEEVLSAIRARSLDPRQPLTLMKFPSAYEKVIYLARDPDAAQARLRAQPLVKELVREILDHAVLYA